MSHLLKGSEIFRKVLAEIDHKYLESIVPLVHESDINQVTYEPLEMVDNSNNGDMYQHSNECRQKRRVRWVDQCKKMPIASERRHCHHRRSKQDVKSILKYKQDFCLVYIS
jgi:hypothetical protein